MKRTKLERGDIKKYQFYEELSFNLYSLSSLININTLSFMITHSIMIEYSRNREYNDKLLSQCVSNELITIASTQGVSIFDLEIAITFVVSIIFDSNTLSILYPKGFEGLYTLISIKKNIDGDLLNDTGFSLKQIGDFVDNVSFEAEEKSLSHEEITQLVETSITEKYEQIQAFKHEKQRIEPVKTRQLVSPVSGGNNNPKSKHNAKYRKKYKKFAGYKSEWVCDRIVEVSSNEGDLVYVPFVGTGTECLSCLLSEFKIDCIRVSESMSFFLLYKKSKKECR